MAQILPKMLSSTYNSLPFWCNTTWAQTNELREIHEIAATKWVHYQRTSLAANQTTVADIIGSVAGVIPNSRLAKYGNYRYDLDAEDIYSYCEDTNSESCFAQNNAVNDVLENGVNDSVDELCFHPIVNRIIEEEEKYNASLKADKAMRLWIDKVRILLNDIRHTAHNMDIILDDWTQNVLKSCMWFLTVLKNDQSIANYMEVQTLFIANYEQLLSEPISRHELPLIPNTFLDENININETEIYNQLLMPQVYRNWMTAEEGNEFWRANSVKCPWSRAFSETDLLKRNNTTSSKSKESIAISEEEGKELLGPFYTYLTGNNLETDLQRTQADELLIPNNRVSSGYGVRANNLFPSERNKPVNVTDGKNLQFASTTNNKYQGAANHKDSNDVEKFRSVSFTQYPAQHPIPVFMPASQHQLIPLPRFNASTSDQTYPLMPNTVFHPVSVAGSVPRPSKQWICLSSKQQVQYFRQHAPPNHPTFLKHQVPKIRGAPWVNSIFQLLIPQKVNTVAFKQPNAATFRTHPTSVALPIKVPEMNGEKPALLPTTNTNEVVAHYTVPKMTNFIPYRDPSLRKQQLMSRNYALLQERQMNSRNNLLFINPAAAPQAHITCEGRYTSTTMSQPISNPNIHLTHLFAQKQFQNKTSSKYNESETNNSFNTPLYGVQNYNQRSSVNISNEFKQVKNSETNYSLPHENQTNNLQLDAHRKISKNTNVLLTRQDEAHMTTGENPVKSAISFTDWPNLPNFISNMQQPKHMGDTSRNKTWSQVLKSKTSQTRTAEKNLMNLQRNSNKIGKINLKNDKLAMKKIMFTKRHKNEGHWPELSKSQSLKLKLRKSKRKEKRIGTNGSCPYEIQVKTPFEHFAKKKVLHKRRLYNLKETKPIHNCVTSSTNFSRHSLSSETSNSRTKMLQKHGFYRNPVVNNFESKESCYTADDKKSVHLYTSSTSSSTNKSQSLYIDSKMNQGNSNDFSPIQKFSTENKNFLTSTPKHHEQEISESQNCETVTGKSFEEEEVWQMANVYAGKLLNHCQDKINGWSNFWNNVQMVIANIQRQMLIKEQSH